MLGKVATNTGATVWARGVLYMTAVQLVLLYGSESWMITGDMLKVLGGFHNWVSRSITGITARHTTSGEWEWPPVAEALETAGI